MEDVLLRMGMYEFLEYAQQAGISDQLSGKVPGNYTIFIPSLQVFTGIVFLQKKSPRHFHWGWIIIW